MRNRSIPFLLLCVVFVVCLIISIVLVFIIRGKVLPTVIPSFRSEESMYNQTVLIDYIITPNSAKYYRTDIDAPLEKVLDNLDSSNSIVLAETDGGMTQYAGSFSQQFTISTVIYTDDPNVVPGAKFSLFRAFGMDQEMDSSVVRFVQGDGLNILTSGTTYLLFLTASPIRSISDSLEFYLIDNTFCVIDINRHYAAVPCPSYDFSACRGVLHLSGSVALSELYAAREEELLAHYLHGENG